MRLPIQWLKRYVSVTLPAEKLAQALTLSGTKVEDVETRGGERVIHIEVTTNRPDCLSIWGLAAEVSALTGKRAKFPKPAVASRAPQKAPLRISIEDKKGCLRYTARVLRDATVRATPPDAQKLIEAAGARAVNNVVDATNFVLFETGQPLHAFDLDKLVGPTLSVRRARGGEKMVAIDGVEYTLDADTLVIADGQGPVAMAGVMGGKRTEVTSATKNILLESALFDPALVRRASKRYKLSSESSYRFERGVDPALVPVASARARDLIVEWAGANEAAAFTDVGQTLPPTAAPVLSSVSRIETKLGLAVGQKRMLAILNALGLSSRAVGKDGIRTVPGTSRRDITTETDIAEEVLRIEGFDKVRPAIPMTHHADDAAVDPKPSLVFALKSFMAAQGFSEIMTFSLLSEKALRDTGFTRLERAQKLRTPLSAAQEYLRPTLLPGMLEAILYNIHRKAEDLRFFEIGNRYIDGREETVLTVAMTGAYEANWLRKSTTGFFDIKGAAENALAFLKAAEVRWREQAGEDGFAYAAAAEAQERTLARAGEVSAAALARWDIARPVFAAEVYIDAAVELYRKAPAPQAKRPARFPRVRRDIAFVIDAGVRSESLEAALQESAGPALAQVSLFDVFTGKNIAAGKRSLAYSLYFQKEEGTFTDAEIGPLVARATAVLRDKFNAEIRA